MDEEVPVSANFLSKDGINLYSFDAGVKIFGGWSRALDQRSLALFARSSYGQKEFDYPFFDSLSYSSFQSIVLRNSGNDFLNANMRDVFMSSLMEGAGLDIQAYLPCLLYTSPSPRDATLSRMPSSA